MTRDDVRFLIEKAAAFYLIVYGIEWLPELLDAWMSMGHEDTSKRAETLRTIVPLAAGVLLMLRRTPPDTAASPAPSTPAPASPLRRGDWLWIGLKLLGAGAVLYGASNLLLAVAWLLSMKGSAGGGTIVFGQLGWIVGGAWLFFSDQLWRLACREQEGGDALKA